MTHHLKNICISEFKSKIPLLQGTPRFLLLHKTLLLHLRSTYTLKNGELNKKKDN